jgi:hypothetical protein
VVVWLRGAGGEDLWGVTKDGRMLRCELRDESREGFCWDVVIRDNDALSFSRRCETERLARYVADTLKEDHLKAGWTVLMSEKGGA